MDRPKPMRKRQSHWECPTCTTAHKLDWINPIEIMFLTPPDILHGPEILWCVNAGPFWIVAGEVKQYPVGVPSPGQLKRLLTLCGYPDESHPH